MTDLASPKPGFTLRLNTMALAVADLPAMVDWYRDVLGLRIAEQGRFEGVGAAYVMLDGEGFRLELVSRAKGDHRPVDRTAPPLHLDVLGWKALVLETGDLAALGQQLRKHEVETFGTT